MSFYSLVFTVPKNTAEAAPYEQELPISDGVIHQVSVLIPAGHAGLTGCALDVGLHQVAPTNQNEWFRGDDVHFSYQESIEVPVGTREMVLRGFNTDTLYDHSFVIGVGIMPSKVYNDIVELGKKLEPLIADMAALRVVFNPPPPSQEG